MIALIALLAAASLAGASLECPLPGSTPEGCVYCYSCRVEKTTSINYTVEYISTIDFEKCRAITAMTSPPRILCMKLGEIAGLDVFKKKRIEVPISSVQEECVCDPNPVTMNCLNSSDNIFILEYPRKCFDNMTICHWNLPQADQVYMHLLKQDIEGNPNDGASGCKDKLIMKSESWSLVTCGKLPTTRPATRIYNRIHNEVPSVFFFSENGMEGCFQILVYLESRMSMNDMATMIERGTENTTVNIDTCAQPSGKPFTTCCTCPEINISELCPSNSWAKNRFIAQLKKLRSTSRCSGIGETGFSGLKGCIGAEFLTRNIPPSTLTEEECENMRLGLSDMEAKVFLSRNGGSLWCGCYGVPSSPRSFCGGDEATRPDAKELVKLEQLIAGRADVDECANSGNAILQKVAAFLQDNQSIPVLRPSPCE